MDVGLCVTPLIQNIWCANRPFYWCTVCVALYVCLCDGRWRTSVRPTVKQISSTSGWHARAWEHHYAFIYGPQRFSQCCFWNPFEVSSIGVRVPFSSCQRVYKLGRPALPISSPALFSRRVMLAQAPQHFSLRSVMNCRVAHMKSLSIFISQDTDSCRQSSTFIVWIRRHASLRSMCQLHLRGISSFFLFII